jgi:DNA-binding NarL/FixJ family response regulator
VIGYIPKSASGAEFERAFERILAGEVYFPRRLIQVQSEVIEAPPARAAEVGTENLAALTPREREVVQHLGRGLSVQRIAAELNLTSHTVRVHLGNIMRKLKLPDRSAIVHFAINLANTRGEERA